MPCAVTVASHPVSGTQTPAGVGSKEDPALLSLHRTREAPDGIKLALQVSEYKVSLPEPDVAQCPFASGDGALHVTMLITPVVSEVVVVVSAGSSVAVVVVGDWLLAAPVIPEVVVLIDA